MGNTEKNLNNRLGGAGGRISQQEDKSLEISQSDKKPTTTTTKTKKKKKRETLKIVFELCGILTNDQTYVSQEFLKVWKE